MSSGYIQNIKITVPSGRSISSFQRSLCTGFQQSPPVSYQLKKFNMLNLLVTCPKGVALKLYLQSNVIPGSFPRDLVKRGNKILCMLRHLFFALNHIAFKQKQPASFPPTPCSCTLHATMLAFH